MARTGLYAPAHRVAPRMPVGSGQGAPNQAPSADFAGTLLQDTRILWNTSNSGTGAQVIGWYMNGCPLIDAVPATLGTTSVAAAQVPTAGTPLTLVSTTGAGITVSAAAFLALPSLVTIPAGTLFSDGLPGYIRFGASDFTVAYDPTTMLARNVQIGSVGNDSTATFSVLGYDWYGYVMHETVTGSNAGTAAGKKAFKGITSVTPAGTLSGSNVSVGMGDTYGLPLQAARSSMMYGFWNNLIATGAGTFTAAVTTNPATATTGDVRGTYLVGSASNGTKRLTIWVAPDPSLQLSQGWPQGLTGVAQF